MRKILIALLALMSLGSGSTVVNATMLDLGSRDQKAQNQQLSYIYVYPRYHNRYYYRYNYTPGYYYYNYNPYYDYYDEPRVYFYFGR